MAWASTILLQHQINGKYHPRYLAFSIRFACSALTVPPLVHACGDDSKSLDVKPRQVLSSRPYTTNHWAQGRNEQAVLHWAHGRQRGMGCWFLCGLFGQLPCRCVINAREHYGMSQSGKKEPCFNLLKFKTPNQSDYNRIRDGLSSRRLTLLQKS